MAQVPTIGRIVRYRLTAADAEQINRRRTTGASIALRIADNNWPMGAQAHIGSVVAEGDVFPTMIVKTWGDLISGQVFLDGNDVLWITGTALGDGPGMFFWPQRD